MSDKLVEFLELALLDARTEKINLEIMGARVSSSYFRGKEAAIEQILEFLRSSAK